MIEARDQASPPVVYIMSRFPLLTETFILREMLELERQGLRLAVFPLIRVKSPVRHAELGQLRADIHYTPFISAAIISANLRFLLRRPRRYARTLWSVLKGNRGDANLFAGALGVFPKSVFFARLVEERGARHVHAHYATHPALSALVISELTGVGFSFTAHAHDIFVHTRMLAEKVEKARFVVAISEFNRQYMARLAPGASAEKIHVVHCGIEPEKYAAQPGPRVSSNGNAEHGGAFTALCVASLQPYKGIKHLVKACALLDGRAEGFRCFIVGEGQDRAELEALIARLRLEGVVQLLGARPQHEVAALLKESDLFVLPSVVAPDGQMEGIPVALMEAMASRLPVVATRLSGIPELIEDGASGLLVPPGDEEALADAIATLHGDDGLRRRMGERGRRKVMADFVLRDNVAKLRSLFENVTAALDPEICRMIEERAAGYLAGLAEGASVGLKLSRLGAGHDSEVYDVSIAAAGRERNLVLKLHRPGRAETGRALERGRSHAANEFRALNLLWPEFSRRSERLGVPRPVDFLPEHAALLIEKCPGEKLEHALRWARLRRRDEGRLLHLIEGCGEWLALFHQMTRREGSPAGIYQRIERDFYADLEECRARGLGRAHAASVARRFEQEKGAAFAGRHAVVGRHCDFAPYNVILSGDKIAVIDFEGMQDGIIYDDLCYFLGMIEATPSYHLDGRLRRVVCSRFIGGYTRRGELDERELDLFMLTAMVKHMAHSPVLGGAPGWRAALKRRQRLMFFLGWFEKRAG